MANLIRRRPSALARSMGWPFDGFFDDLAEAFVGGPAWPETSGRTDFVPAVDVAEDEAGFTLTAEVPGIGKDDLEVSVHDGVLTLRGEKKEEETREDAGWRRVERRFGRFERNIRLPEQVDAEKIVAGYKDGVLKLTLPKAEVAKARQIKIT